MTLFINDDDWVFKILPIQSNRRDDILLDITEYQYWY